MLLRHLASSPDNVADYAKEFTNSPEKLVADFKREVRGSGKLSTDFISDEELEELKKRYEDNEATVCSWQQTGLQEDGCIPFRRRVPRLG
jgi:hypothetical protein